MSRSRGQYVYLTDQLGSVRDVVDASTGSLVGSLDYSPYGQVQRKSGTVSPVIQFAQLPWDGNAGLSVSTTRFYDASVGRWMSRDPIREKGGINLYAYVGGSPINLTDPTGNCPMCLAAPLAPEVVGGAVLLLGGAGWIQQNVINPNVFPQSTPLAPPLVFPSKSLPSGFLPGDKGAEEWGRRNGVDRTQARKRFHDAKQDDGGKPKENYGVNPETGDVCNPGGEVVDNLEDRKAK